MSSYFHHILSCRNQNHQHLVLRSKSLQESELRLRSAGVIPVVTDLNSPSEHLYDQRVGSRLGMLRLFIVPHKLVLTLHTVFSMRRPQVSLMKCLPTQQLLMVQTYSPCMQAAPWQQALKHLLWSRLCPRWVLRYVTLHRYSWCNIRKTGLCYNKTLLL